jgi:hypothetical protein
MNPVMTTDGKNSYYQTANTNKPRAWLNIIVLDEHMNPVIDFSGRNKNY